MMECVKCWYIHERDFPYHPETWGELSKKDIKELNDLINTIEHSESCPKRDKE